MSSTGLGVFAFIIRVLVDLLGKFLRGSVSRCMHYATAGSDKK